jgi:low affinity Fe/Cu permease
MARQDRSRGGWLERTSTRITALAGSTGAFALAAGTIILWAAVGPLFHYSDTWQLAINTGTTIVTFLMVFLIQRSQNKDSLAVQLKLNELVAAIEGSSNRLIDVEDLSEEELRVLHKYYRRLAQMAKADLEIGRSHSIEEAEHRHAAKITQRPKHDSRRK